MNRRQFVQHTALSIGAVSMFNHPVFARWSLPIGFERLVTVATEPMSMPKIYRKNTINQPQGSTFSGLKLYYPINR